MDNNTDISSTLAKTNWIAINKRSIFTKFHIDGPIFLVILLLFSLGLLAIYSARLDFVFIQKQGLRLIISILMMFCVAQIPPRFFRNWAPWIYFISLFMLIMVLFFGNISKGAQRWLDLGFIRFQPAEFMKLAVPLMIARILDPQILPPSIKSLILPTLYIMIPTVLIMIQPDLGTAILVACSGFLVIFFAGISWRLLAGFFGLGTISAPIFWLFLKSYQKKRLLTLLNPERDPLGSGYHIIQSKIAIGSGGLFGKGWLNGTQSHLEFLPERTTDFIFAVFGEEFGFIGILILLILYIFIIIRGLYIGMQAQDTFCRLLSGSLIISFFVYVFVNIGMVNGILPVVGIPLPLISYGGTSLVTIMISFGILMSIHTHRSLLSR